MGGNYVMRGLHDDKMVDYRVKGQHGEGTKWWGD